MRDFWDETSSSLQRSLDLTALSSQRFWSSGLCHWNNHSSDVIDGFGDLIECRVDLRSVKTD